MVAAISSILRVGLLDTTKGWSDLLNMLLGSRLDAVRRSGLL